MEELTLGSLFDGSGGFPLAATRLGIRPAWASEIEPFPIRVTTRRLPQMRHLGDITKIHGGHIEAVDIITFGSPCQDLSVAGRMDGLSGGRSSLFFEAVRIIREMREATDGHKPRYAVWENVPGAFSSNDGQDFQTVLEALAGIVQDDVHVPRPERWRGAGLLLGDGFSIAWRVLDAQYWGVPQRRRRIFLVADLAGGGAGKVLFDSEGMSGDGAQGDAEGTDVPRGAEGGSGDAGDGGLTGPVLYRSHPQDSRVEGPADTADTVLAHYGTGGGNQPMVLMPVTMKVRMGTSGSGGRGALVQDDMAATLSTSGSEQTLFQPRVWVAGKADHFTRVSRDMAPSLVATDSKEPPVVARSGYVVRRLTPLECARLQGFPDDWCDGLDDEDPSEEDMEFWVHVFRQYAEATGRRPRTERQIRKWLAHPASDGAEYRMWGNGVALPCVMHVLGGIRRWYGMEDDG